MIGNMIPGAIRGMIDSKIKDEESHRKMDLKQKLKNSKNETSLNNSSDWETQANNFQFKLSLLIIIYAYSQDDQVISKKEKRSIKKMLSKVGSSFSKFDVKEVLNHLNIKPNAQYILSYIRDNEISEYVFNKSLSYVLESFKHNQVYKDLVKRIQTEYEMSL